MENYEQKYKAALGWMQCLYNGLHGKTKEEAVRFFPELKESEGEKIKELLKHYLEVRRCQTKDNEEYINCNHFLAWLEKQGKQKTDIPKWKYKKDNAPLSKDCLILNRYGCVVKAVSGAMVSDAWVLDYDELVKLPKEEVKKQDNQKPQGKSALEASKEKKIDNANKVEQSSAWSEEDDYNVQCLVAKVTSDIQNGNVGRNQELIDWLKSIKDRVQPQNLWKPSDEQIKALEYFIRGIGESGHVSPYDANLKLVHSLLNNLKKLK